MIRYTIHQINSLRDTKRYIFTDSKFLLKDEKLSFPPPKELYDEIYSDTQESFDPDEVFTRFNIAHPKGYTGRSLTTSDVLQYHLNEYDSLWLFCDSFGYYAIDFRPEYKITKEPEYKPGTKSESETVTLFYESKGKTQTTTVDVSLLNSKRKIGIDQNGQEINLTPGEFYNIQLALIRGREQLRAKETIKSLEGWENSGIPTFGDYVYPGERITDSLVKHFLDILPPALNKSGYLQAGGEVCRLLNSTGKCEPCFPTFVQQNSHWIYAGICFLGENENKVPLYTLNNLIQDHLF